MLSVIIITKDEEKMIKACLSSVKWADEIVVVDDGSTDDTIKIAKAEGAKIVSSPQITEKDFSRLRNLGLQEAKGDWILYVDADERVLKPLKEEIQNILTKEGSGAWAISRRNIILGAEKKYPAFWPDYVIRLFKRVSLQCWQGKVHESPKFSGKLAKLENSFLHLTHRDIDSMVLKSLDWANIDARLRYDSGHPPMSSWRFLKILFSEIFNQGILRQGFFNGTVGVIDSLLQAFSLYISYVKLWQLQQKKSLQETYDDIDKKLIQNEFNF
ncbi:MAG: glycosyltransferase family 2 protein [Candidatus Daviesbacteria bacterium]|nr:MAG: glycosyltransferase family 2 protein [Candidatus Daviesbacteria bacterium]